MDMDSFSSLVTMYVLRIIYAAAIFIVGRWVAKWIKKLLKRLMVKSNMEETLITFTVNLAYAALLAFVIIAALGKLGIHTASFVAVLAAAGLAIGLALQGSLSNFAAGVLLLIFKPFRAGDYVDIAGVSGTVESIDIFTTELKTPDNKKIIVPNARITNDNITNYSANDIRRVDLVIGVGYGDDLSKVKEIITGMLQSDSRVLEDPAPTVAVLELADSSVNFAVRPWTSTADYWAFYFDFMQAVKEKFDAEGVSIPFPQRDVHLLQEN